MDEPKEVDLISDDISQDITKEITDGAGKINIDEAATDKDDADGKMEEDEVEMIEEDEDISGADKPGGPEDNDGESTDDPDYRRYGDPQDFEVNDQSSSSSSDSDDESQYGSNSVGPPPPDESSSCSNSSINEFESQGSSQGDSSSRSFYSKRTTQQSIPYNFKLMTQELSNGQSKFMENFDPERSNREKRKLTRKISTKKATLYDDAGLMGIAQLDICDCMSEECPGCHFPCPKCFSNKCGHECRQNRRWMYEEINIEGTDLVIRNSAYYSVSNEPRE